MALKGVIPFNPGNEGPSALGGIYPRLGPCNVYYGDPTPATLTGTTAVVTDSTTVTGTGTAFNTELAVGDYVAFGSMTSAVKVTAIASATSMTVSKKVTTAAGDAVKKINCIYLGQTQDTTLKYGLKKKDLTESQNGESPADRAVTGYECTVEMTLTRASLARLGKMLQGFILHKTAGGDIDGGAFTLPIGEMDSEVVDKLTIVRIVKGAESTDAADTITIPRAAPTLEAIEAKFDSSSQFVTKGMFTGYADENTLFSGKPVIFSVGTLTP